MQPLAIEVGHFGTPKMHHENISGALGRGLPELTPALCAHDGTCVIVGSGPSLPSFVDELKAERAKGRPIIAVKGSHDFLCEQGIEPDLFVSVEPRDRRNNLKSNPERTIYLLASRVAPEVFDHVKDRKVILWHSWGDGEENEVFKNTGKFLIGGGSTSGLRAITIAYVMGFRNVILVGMDSCLAADGQTKRFDGSKAGQIVDICLDSEGKGRKFLANYAMAAQAKDFQNVWRVMPDLHVEAWGDGLLAHIIEERKKAGKRT